jgi:RNA polymerase sigma factor (sigma-70 family)
MGGRKKRRKTRAGRRPSGPAPGAQLRGQFYPPIRSWFAARVASGREADELTEEVLARLAGARPPADPQAYLAAAAANALAQYRRRQARERDFLRKLRREVAEAGGECGRGPETWFAEAEPGGVPGTAEEVFRELSPEKAEMLRLRFLEGLRVAEVARRVGCSRAAAYKRLERIIQRLRQQYGVEPPPRTARDDRKKS